MTAASSPNQNRLAFVDHLRVSLTALVVAHHVAIGVGGPGLWYFMLPGMPGPISQLLLAMFVAVNQAFFMSLFFAVSAYFVPVSFEKKGGQRFLMERLKRLGLPMLVFFFVLNPGFVYLARWLSGRDLPGSYWEVCGLGPLWFVFTLLLFSLVYLAAQRVGLTGKKPRSMPSNASVFGFILTAGILGFVVRLVFPIGETVFGLQLAFFPLYVSMFTFGIWAYHNSWLDSLPHQQVRLWFRVALGLIGGFPFIMAGMQMSGALDEGLDVVNGGPQWPALVFALWEPFLCVGISLKLIAVFRERWGQTRESWKWLSSSAYTAYIIHPLFVIVVTWGVGKLGLPALVNFLLVTAIAVPATFIVSNLIRRIPGLSRIL